MMNQVQHAQFLSTGHIILILAAILLLFGGKKIPELMKGLGQGMKEFKDASKGSESTKEEASKKEATIEEK
jgi:sec-independent protein translocase protein TatA